MYVCVLREETSCDIGILGFLLFLIGSARFPRAKRASLATGCSAVMTRHSVLARGFASTTIVNFEEPTQNHHCHYHEGTRVAK